MIVEIYKAVCKRLQLPETGIKYFSLWNNNTDQLAKQKAFKLPAIFVEFDQIEWSQLAQGGKAADIRVRLHLISETLATPEIGGKYQDKALERLERLETIAAKMQGLSGAGFNCFMLGSTVVDNNHEQITHDELEFTTHATDLSGVKQPRKIQGVKLDITR